MNIDSVKRQDYVTAQQPNTQRKAEQTPTKETRFQQRPDRLDISSEARLKSIQLKANSGYYNKPEIIKDVARKINNETPVTKQQKQ